MISIIMPFKFDSNNRLENLLELISYIKNYWRLENLQLIVAEMDSSSKVVNFLPEWVDYIFAKEKGDNSWSRSKRINLAIPLIRNNITMILDTDLIIDQSCVLLSVNSILKNELDAITPYGKMYHFPRASVLKEMKIGELKTSEFCSRVNPSRIFDSVSGGCFVTKTSVFKHLRGMNELFVGWGLEDDEILNRYVKLGYKYGRIKSVPAVHINHERTQSCRIDPKNFDNSLVEKNRSLLSSKEQILEYFGVTETVGTYSRIDKTLPPDNDLLIEAVKKEKDAYSNLKHEAYEI